METVEEEMVGKVFKIAVEGCDVDIDVVDRCGVAFRTERNGSAAISPH